MKNFSTWLLALFMIMFWGFRVIVTVTSEMHMDFGGITPLNTQVEIILLFVTLISILLVIKRKMLGGLIYLLTYGIYFGTYLVNNIQNILSVELQATMQIGAYMNIFVSVIGIIIPIAVMLDLLIDRGRKINPKDKKTDWFYKNEDYDRKLDDRADKNNYRTM